MKYLFLILAAVFLLPSACRNAAKNEKEKNGTLISNPKTSGTGASEKLTNAQFVQKIWDYRKSPNDWKYLGSKPAIIDFYADWCGPCKISSPILEEIGRKYEGKIDIYKVNTDQERELAELFNITGIPAFLYIPRKGKPVMTSGIGKSKEETKKIFIENIERYLQMK